MKRTTKFTRSACCRSLARALGLWLAAGSLLGFAASAQAQIANSPPAGLDDTKKDDLAKNNLIGFSGDYLIGSGQLSLPFGFALANLNGVYTTRSADLGDRDSTYYGGTISYSYGQSWFFDFSFSQGTSSANAPKTLFDIPLPIVGYQIDDDWYQFYIRYILHRGPRSSLYFRVGATYVDAALTAHGENSLARLGYQQNTALTDIEGNIGFGIAYSILNRSKVRIAIIGEAEYFAGVRNQKVQENYSFNAAPPIAGQAQLDNMLYGGLGRISLRTEFFLGSSQRLRLFADLGFQYRYTFTQYDQAPAELNIFDEVRVPQFESQGFGESLWGPYVKVGLRFSF